jgi:hypothetical protein
MNEKLMYYLWQNPQFMVYPLHTTDNRSLSIVRAGQLNSNSGPDFLFSQIQLNQITWIGHVEMHVQSSDWFAHNHHTDVAYNNVILHVVCEDDVQVHSSGDEPIPTLVLQNYVNEQILGRIKHCRIPNSGFRVPINSRPLPTLDKWLFLIVYLWSV